MPTNDITYTPARFTPQQAKNFEKNVTITDEHKDIYYHNKDTAILTEKLLEQFPNFADILKNAPKEHNERVKYADRLAKANPNMFLSDKVVEDNINDYTNYTRRRALFPTYIGGSFSTKGTKTNPNAFGIRSALLKPDSFYTHTSPGETKQSYQFVSDDVGKPRAKLINLKVNPLDSYLTRSYPSYKNGGRLDRLNILNKWRR